MAAVFKCLSALAALWIPSAQGMAAPGEQPHLCAFVSALFEFSVKTIRTAIARSSDARMREECHHLAGCASEALLATTHIAVNGSTDAAHIAALRSSDAARALADACVTLAAPTGAVWARVPDRVQRDMWMSLADVSVVWTGHVRASAVADWEVAAHSTQHMCAPVVTAWKDLYACACTDGFDWRGAAGVVRPLCAFAVALLAAVGPVARNGRRCMFAAVKPMIEVAVEVLASAHHASACEAALELSRLMVAAVQNSLKEMPLELIDRIMAVSAGATIRAPLTRCLSHAHPLTRCMCSHSLGPPNPAAHVSHIAIHCMAFMALQPARSGNAACSATHPVMRCAVLDS